MLSLFANKPAVDLFYILINPIHSCDKSFQILNYGPKWQNDNFFYELFWFATSISCIIKAKIWNHLDAKTMLCEFELSDPNGLKLRAESGWEEAGSIFCPEDFSRKLHWASPVNNLHPNRRRSPTKNFD